MKPTRREYLAANAGMLAAMTIGTKTLFASDTEAQSRLKVGMCDWSLDSRVDVKAFELAKQIGLDGIEVSIGFEEDNLRLRQPTVQQEYLATARKYNLSIPSVAMGVLNLVPLMSEPRAALWVADTIEAAKNLGASIILLAFFVKGELRPDKKEDMKRVIDVLKELAPRAEKAGIILGLENYLTAEANLKIIEQVNSPAVQVYYDAMNSASKHHDVIKEIKQLGKKICQVHVKEGRHDLLGSGRIDWPAVAGALKEINYRGWIVLETASPKDLISDTRKNLEYVRQVFANLFA